MQRAPQGLIAALPFATANLVGGNSGNQATQGKTQADEISAYPNPAATTLTVAVKTSEARKTAPITLIDALGRVVWSEQRALSEGVNQFDIDVNNIVNGLYFLKIQNQIVRVQIFH